MLPRLAAEESLVAVERAAVASGAVSKEHGRQALRGWREQAGVARRATKRTPQQLHQAGIGVRVVPRTAR
jgi:hypothetical protein